MADLLSPSVWIPDASATTAPLDEDTTCDVVVIGAGLTGLAAALAAARGGARVVVLESDHVGFGASGRNAGHLTPTIGKDLPTLLTMYGRRTGGALVALADAAVASTEQLIAEHDIDCDYVAAGNVLAGIHPGQTKRLRTAVDAAAQLGADVRMLHADEIDRRGLPAFVACAAIEGAGGVLDPGRYVHGLARAATGAGAELFERSRVTELVEHAHGVVVNTAGATVHADRAVVATNAYTPALGLDVGHIVAMRDSQFVTEVLTDDQADRIGWTGGEGIYTAHESLENYRWTADRRIVGGSRYLGYRLGNRIADDLAPEAFASIEARFRDRFPELDDVAVAGCWSGHVAINLNFLPYIGPCGESGRAIAALGYCGHGLAMAGHLGSIAGGMAVGAAEPPEVLDRRRIPLPPEPLRWLSVRAVNGATEIADRRTDRLAAPRR